MDDMKIRFIDKDTIRYGDSFFRRERTCKFENAGDLPDIVHPTVWFCSECGSPIYNDMKPEFCIYCGCHVSGARVERDAS